MNKHFSAFAALFLFTACTANITGNLGSLDVSRDGIGGNDAGKAPIATDAGVPPCRAPEVLVDAGPGVFADDLPECPPDMLPDAGVGPFPDAGVYDETDSGIVDGDGDGDGGIPVPPDAGLRILVDGGVRR